MSFDRPLQHYNRPLSFENPHGRSPYLNDRPASFIRPLRNLSELAPQICHSWIFVIFGKFRKSEIFKNSNVYLVLYIRSIIYILLSIFYFGKCSKKKKVLYIRSIIHKLFFYIFIYSYLYIFIFYTIS